MKFAFSAVMAALSVYVLFFLFNINNNVAKDFETQYYMALSNGSRMQVCVQAGLVAAAYLQAKNSEQYQRWSGTEGRDCRAAGLP
jgi:hypothetical protein